MVVIAIMVAGFYLSAGTIDAPWIELPKGATATDAGGDVAVRFADGSTTSYAKARGYRLSESGVVRIGRWASLPGAGDETIAEILVPGIDSTGERMEKRAWVFRSARGDSQPYFFDQSWVVDASGRGLERPAQISKFLNKQNLVLVLTTSSFFAIMAVGMTLIIVMGGIDLSIGSIYALAAIGGALCLRELPSSTGSFAAVAVAALVTCSIGTLCGIINGLGTVGLRVHPFIITLGGMAVYRGIAFVLSEGVSIAGFPAGFRDTIRREAWGVNPVPTLVMVITGLAGALLASRTTLGRQTFAIGGNETAARYAGIPVGRVKVILFALGGFVAGLAATLGMGYFGSASSADANGYELNVIAAAVVGGASLSGGRGSIFGAVLGAIIIQLIENGFDVLGWNTNYKRIVIGLAIVLAVLVDQAKQRLFAK